MTSRTHEPIPRLAQWASVQDTALSYERLGELRQAAVKVKDSGFLYIHERTHLEEIIDRIDATVRLKRDRDEYWAAREKD